MSRTNHKQRGIPALDGKMLPAPFDSVTPLFSTNGNNSLKPKDAILEMDQVLRSYLRPDTQAAILAKRADLVEAPYDTQDNPMLTSSEVAVRITYLPKGLAETACLEWVRQELDVRITTISHLLKVGLTALSSQQESTANKKALEMVTLFELDPSKLITKLDPSSATVWTGKFNSELAILGAMGAAMIKQRCASFQAEVQSQRQLLEKIMLENSVKIAKDTTTALINHLDGLAALDPALASGTYKALIAQCNAMIGKLKAVLQETESKAQQATLQATTAFTDLGNAGALWGQDEVVRDAAKNALSCGLQAIQAQSTVLRLHRTILTLEGGAVSGVQIPGIVPMLSYEQQHLLARVHKKLEAAFTVIQGHRERFLCIWTSRSKVFEHTLRFDDLDEKGLVEMIMAARKTHPNIPAVQKYLQTGNLNQCLHELRNYLPDFIDNNSFSNYILNSPPVLKRVCTLLSKTKPFAMIDDIIESNQELRHRQDTMVILEIPGGDKNEDLLEALNKNGVINKTVKVVDSHSQEIRMYCLRQGLPFYAFQRLAFYRDHIESYLQTGQVTPFTHEEATGYPYIDAPKTNLPTLTKQVLYQLKAVFPDQIQTISSGGLKFHYKDQSIETFGQPLIIEFKNGQKGGDYWDGLVQWAMRYPEHRKVAERDLNKFLDTNPQVFRNALASAWKTALPDSEERKMLATVWLQRGFTPSIWEWAQGLTLPNVQANGNGLSGASPSSWDNGYSKGVASGVYPSTSQTSSVDTNPSSQQTTAPIPITDWNNDFGGF